MTEPEKRKFSEADIDGADDDEDVHPVARAKTYERFTDEIAVASHKIGAVIGPRGSVVKEIIRRSSCKVVVETDDPPRVVFSSEISQECVEEAKALVERVLLEGNIFLKDSTNGFDRGASREDDSRDDRATIECPGDRVGVVIGASGTVIHDLIARSGASITVNNDAPSANGSKKINITGSVNQVREATRLVNLVITKGPAALNNSQHRQPEPLHNSHNVHNSHNSHNNYSTPHVQHVQPSPPLVIVMELDIPQDRIAVVIGAKGMVLNEIMARSRAKIVIKQDVPEGTSPKVVFTGTQDQIGLGMVLVSAVIADGPSALVTLGTFFT